MHPSSSQNLIQENDLLAKAYHHQELDDYDSARFYFIAASSVFETKGLWEKYAESQIGVTRTFVRTSRYTQVKPILRYVLDLAEGGKISKESIFIAELYAQSSRINWVVDGDYQTALKNLDKALNLCNRITSDKTDLLIYIYNNLGYVYGYLGDFKKSVEAFTKGLDIAIENYGLDHKTIGGHYNNFAFTYVFQGDLEKGEEAIRKGIALDIKSRGAQHPSLAKKYNNLAYIYIQKYDHDQAILYTKKALDLNVGLFGEDHQSVGINYLNLSASYINKDDLTNSMHYCRKAIANIVKTLGDKSQYLATLYDNLGRNFEKREVPDSAIHYYKKALALRVALYGENSNWALKSHMNLGRFLLAQHRYDESLKALEKALEIAPQALPNKHTWLAESLLHLGNYYTAQGNFIQSLKAYQKALIATVPSFDNLDPFVNPSMNQVSFSVALSIILDQKTQVLYKLYQQNSNKHYLDCASETALLADGLFDLMKNSYQTSESKAYLTNQTISFYETGINIANDLFRLTNKAEFLEEVFNYFEKNKSLLLLENIRANDQLSYSGLPDSLLVAEESLKRDINLYQEKIYEASSDNDSAKIKLYENYYFTKKRDLDALIALLKSEYPEYYGLKYDIAHASIGDIQSYLDPNTTLLEYFEGDSTIYLFCISKTSKELYLINGASEIRQSVNDLRKSITDLDFIEKQPHQSFSLFTESAHFIYKSILQPIVPKFELTTNMIIIPDGPLSYVPFELLIDSLPSKAQSSFKNLAYLTKSKIISYAYSATHLAKNESPLLVAAGNYGGFAPSYDQSSLSFAKSADPAVSSMARDGTFNLPGAIAEVKEATNLFKGQSWLGEDATESIFKESAGNFSILHLALHGLLDDENPLYSKLIFSQFKDSIEDGYLNAFEIYNLDLKAQLVVLSACNTAYGEIKKGEGVMSLARAFAYAGCHNMVASLWRADDHATTDIMNNFYRLLSKGESKDEALRLAKLNYLETADANTAHPYYWAAFTLIGDNKSIIIKQDLSNWYKACIGLVLLFIILGYLFARKKRLSAHL